MVWLDCTVVLFVKKDFNFIQFHIVKLNEINTINKYSQTVTTMPEFLDDNEISVRDIAAPFQIVQEEETFVQEEETFVQEEETFDQEEETFVQEEETFVQEEETFDHEEETSVTETEQCLWTFVALDDDDTISKTKHKYFGPHIESNYIIPDVLIAGAYPADNDDYTTETNLCAILKAGVTCFVCLQSEYDDSVPESTWRRRNAIRPYFKDVKRLVNGNATIESVRDTMSTLPVTEADIEFIHLPIKDCNVTDDDKVWQLVLQLETRIRAGKKIYLHCWGGHGRTGTVACILLAKMYGTTAVEAMRYNNIVHMIRKQPIVVGSPQTFAQSEQVVRIVKDNILNMSM